MDATLQERLLTEIGELIAHRTTAMAGEVYHQPAWHYTDPQRQAQERRHLFTRFPVMLVASCAVARPGDFVTVDVAGTPVLVVRGDDGVVRTLVNICRHRANRVCHEESGTARTFACNYHAWTYDRRGRARSFVDADGFEGLDRADFGLQTFPTEERHGLVWCVPTAQAGIDVADFLGADLDAELASYGIGGFTHYHSATLTDLRFNWKLGIDTFHEAFHLSHLHKKSVGPYFLGNTMAYERLGRHQRFVTVRKTFPEMLARDPAERDLLGHSGIVYWLFPNSAVVWQMDHVELWSLYPDPVHDDRCVARGAMLVPEPPASESAERHWRNNWKALESAILTEDFETMTRIQRNLDSGHVDEIVFGRNEPSLHDLHRTLDDELRRCVEDGVAVGR